VFNPDAPLAEEFSAPIEALLKKLGDALSDATSEGTAFLLYFDIADEFWSNDISDVLFAQFSRMSMLMGDIKMIEDYLKDNSDMSNDDRKGIVAEQDFRLEEMADILRYIPNIIKSAKDRLLKFVRNINSQLKEYESI
jgi:hypothetical protein